MRPFGPPPSLSEIDAIARRALEQLPAPFADHLGALVLEVLDFADDETLTSMDIEDSFDLTGLYVGHPLPERSASDSHTFPDRVFLYRRPILDEWAAGEDSLETLVSHVLIHEVGHHFGLSDDDMHALEAAASGNLAT
jgi:predicted Zn-dependent protease with MMP-like domain